MLLQKYLNQAKVTIDYKKCSETLLCNCIGTKSTHFRTIKEFANTSQEKTLDNFGAQDISKDNTSITP